jgi:hypothetical protein
MYGGTLHAEVIVLQMCYSPGSEYYSFTKVSSASRKLQMVRYCSRTAMVVAWLSPLGYVKPPHSANGGENVSGTRYW